MISWLHVSDFHFRSGDAYDRDVVLRALVKSVKAYHDSGRQPDLIFATGDVAYSGQEKEYGVATKFFDDLIAAAGLERRHLFVIPGNHDIDRKLGKFLTRTLSSREDSDEYFEPDSPKLHITQKQKAFARWFDRYFEGIRAFPQNTTCGPVEAVEVRGQTLGILPINSALFCQDDQDERKLWVGRRCLESALEKLTALNAALNVALIHHPFDWLSDIEAANIKGALHKRVDCILRGHLHKTDVENVAGVTGEALSLAAGAAYQTRKYPNRALYASLERDQLTIFPIRYEDEPEEVWTVDPSLFHQAPDYQRAFPIPRLKG